MQTELKRDWSFMKKLPLLTLVALVLSVVYLGATWAASGFLSIKEPFSGTPKLTAHGLLVMPLVSGHASHLIPLDEKRFLIIDTLSKAAGLQIYNTETAESKAVPIEGLKDASITTATLLKSGMLLLTGHLGKEETPFSRLIEPLNGKSVETGPMKTSRAGYEAILLKDGRVLFFGGEMPNRLPSGGYTLGKPLGVLEIFDPKSQEYTLLSNTTLPQGIGVKAKLQNGQVFFFPEVANNFCDKGKEDCKPQTKISIFDPETLKVIDGGNIPNEPLYDTIKAESQPVFYTTANSIPGNRVLLSSFSHLGIYEPITHQIRILKELFTCQPNDPQEVTITVQGGQKVKVPRSQNMAFSDFAFNLPDGRVLYLVGGNDGNFMSPAMWPKKCNNLFIFSPDSQKLKSIGSVDLPQYAYSAVLMGERLFIVKDKFVYELTQNNASDAPAVLKYLQNLGNQKKLNDDLLSAINAQDIKKMTTLLDQGADINYTTSAGYHSLCVSPECLNIPTTLGYALKTKNEDIILFLLSKGVKHDPDKLVSSASSLGMERVLQALIQEGLKPETLHEALLNARTEKEVDLLVKIGADPNVVRMAFLPEDTSPAVLQSLLKEVSAKHSKEYAQKLMLKALNNAIENKNIEQIKVLMAYEPTLSISHPIVSYTPFSNAAEKGDMELLKLLLPKGIDCSKEPSLVIALSKAAGTGHMDIVRFLLEKGTDPNLQDGKNNVPPLMAAACAGELEIVQYLLNKEASPNLSGGYLGDRSALECTISESHRFKGKAAEIASLLILAGADVNYREDGMGWTPLHFAANKNRRDIARILLEAGADPDIRDREGKKPFEPVNNETREYLRCIDSLPHPTNHQALDSCNVTKEDLAREQVKKKLLSIKCQELNHPNDDFTRMLAQTLASDFEKYSQKNTNAKVILSLKFYQRRNANKTVYAILNLIPGTIDKNYRATFLESKKSKQTISVGSGLKVPSGIKDLDNAALSIVRMLEINELPEKYEGQCFEMTLPQASSRKEVNETITGYIKGIQPNKVTSSENLKPRITHFPAEGCNLVSNVNAAKDPAVKIVYEAFKASQIQATTRGKKKAVMSVAFDLHRIQKVGENVPPHKTIRRYTFKRPNIGPSLNFMKYNKPGYMLARVYGLNISSGDEALDEAAFQSVQNTGPILNYPEAREGECFNIPFPLE